MKEEFLQRISKIPETFLENVSMRTDMQTRGWKL
jgi:hypothetical protein